MNYNKELDRVLLEFGGEQKSYNNAKQWFEDIGKNNKTKNVQLTNFLQIGKLYKFEYNCNEILYDTTPLIVCVGYNKDYDLYNGINLNFLPKEVSNKFVSIIRTVLYSSYNDSIKSKPYNAIEQTPINIPDIILKSLYKSLGVDFAFRNYKLNNMKNINVICFEDWSKMIFLREYNFNTSINENLILKNFQKHFTKK